jgi:hypothetical protein
VLTHLLAQLPITLAHRIQRWLGLFDGMHDWLEGFCPCSVELGDEDYFQAMAA